MAFCLELFQSQTAAQQILLAGDSDATNRHSATDVWSLVGVLAECAAMPMCAVCCRWELWAACDSAEVAIMAVRAAVSHAGRKALNRDVAEHTPAAFRYRM